MLLSIYLAMSMDPSGAKQPSTDEHMGGEVLVTLILGANAAGGWGGGGACDCPHPTYLTAGYCNASS